MKVLLTATVQSHICQFHKPLVAMLHNHACEVHVAARNNLAEKDGLSLDFVEKVFDVPFDRSPFGKTNKQAYLQLKNIIDKGNYQVIHCNTPVGGVLTRMAARNVRRRGTRVIYTAHGFHFYKGASWKNWVSYYPIEKIMAKKTDCLVTLNQEDYQLAKDKFAGQHTRIFFMHGVGVDENRYQLSGSEQKEQLRKEENIPTDSFVLLCIGELIPRKNQGMAIKAMKQIIKTYPQTLLLLAGNGPEDGNLRRMVEQEGLADKVRFLGYTTKLTRYQALSDACISCSNQEGLPFNIIESLLCGNSVIATKIRGHIELIQDGVNGYLVPPHDANALAEKVLALKDHCFSPSTCRESVMSYTSSNIYSELEDLYGYK